MKNLILKRWFPLVLLLVWIVIGAALRLTQLTGKPPWTDEFATLVFSLGNSFQTVPLDRAISVEPLLQPLRLYPQTDASAVIHHLFAEDHHPPLYFVLAHWWMQLFPTSGEYVSLWAARSLPALLGVVSIPAAYGLGWLAFRSRVVAQLAAAMMAVSPYGVFLAQEARHYALGILWVIASLCCLVVAVQHLKRRTPLPIWIALCWVVVNSLGMATHYFFSLTLCAEALVLIGLGIGHRAWGIGKKFLPHSRASTGASPLLPDRQSHWWRIGAVAIGTFVGCLVWVPVWQASHDAQMTQWIASNDRNLLTWISPVFQALATWITMLSLLPVEASALPIVIVSGVVMLVFFIWAVPILYRAFKVLLEQPDTRLATVTLAGFVLGAIAIFFSITYLLGTDLTRGARYNFVYFPAVIVLIGAMLAVSWNASADKRTRGQGNPFEDTRAREHGDTGNPSTNFSASSSPCPMPHAQSKIQNPKSKVALIWLMGLLSGITVVSNLGYQKYYRPDLVMPAIQQASSVPVLIATTHNSLVQTGEMMGLAWEFKRAVDSEEPPRNLQFVLAHQDEQECKGTGCAASTTLRQTLAQLPRPLDLWLVNFKAPVDPDEPDCFAEDASQYPTSVDGYAIELYRCLAPS